MHLHSSLISCWYPSHFAKRWLCGFPHLIPLSSHIDNHLNHVFSIGPSFTTSVPKFGISHTCSKAFTAIYILLLIQLFKHCWRCKIPLAKRPLMLPFGVSSLTPYEIQPYLMALPVTSHTIIDEGKKKELKTKCNYRKIRIHT